MLIEICIDDEAGLEAALRSGAGRLEVCSRLDLGGLTPTPQLLAGALQRATPRAVPVHAMVRPRAQPDFVADEAEFQALCADLARVKSQGAHAVVFGLLDADRRIDRERTAQLVRDARPLAVTFHRAFDRVLDFREALEVLIELGVERVLTSGGAPRAIDGIEVLRQLVQQARGRITILPGGGVREDNAAKIVAHTGVSELHGSVPFRRPSARD